MAAEQANTVRTTKGLMIKKRVDVGLAAFASPT
jgi:hypothetical protein